MAEVKVGRRDEWRKDGVPIWGGERQHRERGKEHRHRIKETTLPFLLRPFLPRRTSCSAFPRARLDPPARSASSARICRRLSWNSSLHRGNGAQARGQRRLASLRSHAYRVGGEEGRSSHAHIPTRRMPNFTDSRTGTGCKLCSVEFAVVTTCSDPGIS